MSSEDKKRLVEVVRHDWSTRHMTLIEIQNEAGLGHVSKATIIWTLHEKGLKAYVEEQKFILSSENKPVRLVCSSIILFPGLFVFSNIL
jgi:hypothetical protein